MIVVQIVLFLNNAKVLIGFQRRVTRKVNKAVVPYSELVYFRTLPQYSNLISSILWRRGPAAPNLTHTFITKLSPR